MQLKPTRTVYTVSDFLDWQRNGALRLKPVFQRREVWGAKAKSLLIDTVVKGLPVPIIFLRKAQDLTTLKSTLEVIDGQQRLRTIFSYVDPTVLADYAKAKDDFSVLEVHNRQIAGRSFRSLPPDLQQSILGYEISTHVFPPDTADEVVLRIFARLNSTGSKLNHQELRNAQYFGAFKSFVYDLAIQSLALWRKWGIFDEDDFARMNEVEATSEYVAAMMFGIQAKTQKKLDQLYEKYDDKLDGSQILAQRFEAVLDAVDQSFGEAIKRSSLRRQALFYSLFTAIYDHLFGLRSDYKAPRAAKRLPLDLANRFAGLNQRIVAEDLPLNVVDAMVKATADKSRRLVRHKFFIEALGLESAR